MSNSKRWKDEKSPQDIRCVAWVATWPVLEFDWSSAYSPNPSLTRLEVALFGRQRVFELLSVPVFLATSFSWWYANEKASGFSHSCGPRKPMAKAGNSYRLDHQLNGLLI